MAPPRPDKPNAPRPQAFYAPLPSRQSLVPLARPLGESLAGDGGLSSLLARVRASQARLDALADVLPGLLRQHLRAGPLDDDGWTILAANSAVASKLRHLLPTLAETLVAKGWQATSIRVKVQSTLAPGGK
ncbi:DciA family protein [Scleromatobacter humisilvae]|uniref:DciA family protein n=1 Tax=Scleromatobacter humisilvae TaxID=2897159 RepID=A0A9X1YI86_9BURK|nr:DciA family protein [Scleromatobacter humisilvae]MCK9684862.1 DciA family protein [Scleromatobacter humisilvae]